MAKHHPDLIFCRKQAGVAIGRLCEKCDGKCVICDSYVRPCTLVRICDECNYGSYQGRCVICGGPGVSDAYYCKECTIQEKDVGIREMVVPRLSTWAVLKQTCFMKGRSTVSRRGEVTPGSLFCWFFSFF
ncbi:unnamed protein product [Tetraodon nigroviridis]|uniref:(spotted green pufferfish) hypothetical protein n=1 Tax=Tetraodon nigroviridis TaxID=99883 RepID=Q4S4C3_TETNG|nr:unnamed protein product [Tetraodon nigroviridis]